MFIMSSGRISIKSNWNSFISGLSLIQLSVRALQGSGVTAWVIILDQSGWQGILRPVSCGGW